MNREKVVKGILVLFLVLGILGIYVDSKKKSSVPTDDLEAITEEKAHDQSIEDIDKSESKEIKQEDMAKDTEKTNISEQRVDLGEQSDSDVSDKWEKAEDKTSEEGESDSEEIGDNDFEGIDLPFDMW